MRATHPPRGAESLRRLLAAYIENIDRRAASIAAEMNDLRQTAGLAAGYADLAKSLNARRSALALAHGGRFETIDPSDGKVTWRFESSADARRLRALLEAAGFEVEVTLGPAPGGGADDEDDADAGGAPDDLLRRRPRLQSALLFVNTLGWPPPRSESSSARPSDPSASREWLVARCLSVLSGASERKEGVRKVAGLLASSAPGGSWRSDADYVVLRLPDEAPRRDVQAILRRIGIRHEPIGMDSWKLFTN